jgi:hypothetical protein
MVARPKSEASVVDVGLNLAGCMLPTNEGVAIGCIFGNDNSGDEPDRIAIKLSTGETFFHDRKFQAAYAAWVIEFIDEHDEVALRLTRAQPST